MSFKEELCHAAGIYGLSLTEQQMEQQMYDHRWLQTIRVNRVAKM